MNTQTKLIIGVVAVIVIIVGVVFARSFIQSRTVVTVVNETVERPVLNFAFTFPSGEAGYSFIEAPVSEAKPGELEAAFILIKTQDYLEFQQAATPEGEAPQSITLLVFAEPEEVAVATGTPRLDRMTRLRNWAQSNNTITSINTAFSEPQEVDIDGVKMLNYQTDGLYQQDVYIGFYRDRYYVIVGQYDGENDPARSVFQDMIRSLTFL